jgi:hypothetical protein
MSTATIPPMPADQLERLELVSPVARWIAHAAWAYTNTKDVPEFTRDDMCAMATLYGYYPDDPATAGVLVAELSDTDRAELAALLPA